MSEKEERASSQEVVNFLSDRSELLTTAGLDLSVVLEDCQTLLDSATLSETQQHTAFANKLLASSASGQALRAAYKRASGVVKMVEGYLGRDNEHVHGLHQLRDDNLTEQKKRDFIRQIIEFLTEQTQLLSAAGFDPAETITALTGLADTSDDKETFQHTATVSAVIATSASVASTAAAYKKVSETMEIVAGFLGEDHPIVREMRKIRNKKHRPDSEDGESETSE